MGRNPSCSLISQSAFQERGFWKTIELRVLCEETLDSGGKTVVPTTRRRDTMNRASKERGHTVVVSGGQAVHEECCRNFTNKHSIQNYLIRKQETESVAGFTQSLRSQNQRFNFAKCLFCSNESDVNVSNGPKVHPVRTLDFLKTPFRSMLKAWR